MESGQTNKFDAQVLAFMDRVGVRTCCPRLHEYLDSINTRFSESNGCCRNTAYSFSVFTPAILEQLGHDSPEVREFVSRCSKASGWLKNVETLQNGQSKMEEIRKRLEGVLAGQSVSSSSEVKESAGRKPLTREKDLKRKLQAEEHKDPRSQDWKDAPGVEETRALYRHIMKRLIRGQKVYVSSIPSHLDDDGSRLAWLASCPFLILRTLDDELLAMPDRGEEEARIEIWAGRETDMREYPGLAEGINPFAGRRWGSDLDQHVRTVLVRSAEEGRHLSNRQVAYVLNTSINRGEHRAVSIAAVKRSIKRLTEGGELVVVKFADRYRHNHAWVNIPAQYGRPEDFPFLARRTITLKDGRSVTPGEDLAWAA